MGCDLPAKGNVGEVFGALYMLFCSDVIRNEKSSRGGVGDPLRMKQSLSIDLNEWFELLKNGGKTTDQKPPAQVVSSGVTTRQQSKNVTDTANARQYECTLSLLQFCRNDLRSDKSFFQEGFLEYMFWSGVAVYAYPNCAAIDLIASIRVKDQDEQVRYHPLVVSVKNWNEVDNSHLLEWRDKMKKYMRINSQKRTAVCIILYLGCSKPPKLGDQKHGESVFPEQTVYHVVGVKDDEFGIDDAVLRLGDLWFTRIFKIYEWRAE